MSSGYGWGVYVANAMYSSYGEPLMVDAGNYYALVRTHTYEPGTRRLASTALNVEGTAGTSYAASYSYDPAGNIARIDNNPTQVGVARDTQCFDYDGLRRLTSAWTPKNASCTTVKRTTNLGGPAKYWTDFTYDPVGNRTSTTDHTTSGAGTSDYTYPAPGQDRPHALTSVGSGSGQSTFAYDEAGNTTIRDLPGQNAQTLTWDVEGELGSVDQAGKQGSEFIYTAGGDRLVRSQEGVTTVYLPGGQELTLTASGQQKATRYYSFNGQTIAMRTGPGFDDVTTLTSDHQATATTAVTNISRQVTRRYGTPFGGERGQNSGMAGDHGFLDKPEDTTGLTAIGARYYDNTTGRFITVDPIMDLTDPQQWAAYNYSNNNPTTWSDPTGMLPLGSGDYRGYDPRRTGSAKRSSEQHLLDSWNGGGRSSESIARNVPVSTAVKQARRARKVAAVASPVMPWHQPASESIDGANEFRDHIDRALEPSRPSNSYENLRGGVQYWNDRSSIFGSGTGWRALGSNILDTAYEASKIPGLRFAGRMAAPLGFGLSFAKYYRDSDGQALLSLSQAGIEAASSMVGGLAGGYVGAQLGVIAGGAIGGPIGAGVGGAVLGFGGAIGGAHFGGQAGEAFASGPFAGYWNRKGWSTW